MASRKSNVVLTIEQRQTIIGQSESGVPVSTIAAMYNVHPITVRRIRQDAARINRLVDSNEKHKKIKRFKKPVYEDLEHKLYMWFVERRAVGVIITNTLLMEKAAEFSKSLQLPTFRASRGCATNFKKRHNIRLFKLHGEKESADESAATIFLDNFKTLMEEEDIDIANVYNMDETGLVWKALPQKTLAEDKQKCGGSKLRKDRVTVGLCANVLGTHKLVPLFIHKYKSPRALNNINTKLPVVYKSQKNSWINKDIFEEWFNIQNNIQNRDESNDSDEENNKDQEEARLSGRTKQELQELKHIHERLNHLCATDPPDIREMYEVLRRYHFGEYDKETTRRRELRREIHRINNNK